MIDQRFMDDLAKDFVLPREQLVEDTMLAAGPVTSDVPQTGVRLGRAGVTPQQSAKAGGLDKPLIALLDTLAGALRGATGATIGLPGDIRSIVDMINQEGAEAVMGKRMFPTSEEVLQSNILPQVVPAGAPNAAERQKTVDIAQNAGEFLPLPGVIDVSKAVTKTIKKGIKATKNMPVGMSTQMVGEGVSELGFYSAAKEAVDSIQQPKGTGEQFLKQIEKTPGVKPEEIKWTGLDDFLKSKKSVTKVEVQEFLDKNRVEVKEVKLGEPNESEIQALLNDEMGQGITRQDVIDFLANDEGFLAPKFSKYTLPGGENYREILLTLPQKPSKFELVDDKGVRMSGQFDNQADAQKFIDEFSVSGGMFEKNKPSIVAVGDKNTQFKSNHFDQPNILAHLRVNDRVDADGKKVLFVEEVQSDWHQTGRQKGYTGDVQAQLGKINEQRQILLDEQRRYEKLAEPYTSQNKDAPSDVIQGWTTVTEQLRTLQTQQNKLGQGVPNAPFKTTWHELAMKRAIQLAAEGGYDRVAFTTGKTQAERYDLSKEISEVSLSGTNLVAYDKQGNAVIKQTGVTKDNLSDYIGKESAQKLLDQEPQGTLRTISGLDLQVGGEGMKKFYDQILPKFLDKYAKKWDAKTGMTKIRLATDAEDAADSALLQDLGMDGGVKATASVQYIDVTPKMKESVLTKGQPLFAIGAGGAAVQQEDNQ